MEGLLAGADQHQVLFAAYDPPWARAGRRDEVLVRLRPTAKQQSKEQFDDAKIDIYKSVETKSVEKDKTVEDDAKAAGSVSVSKNSAVMQAREKNMQMYEEVFDETDKVRNEMFHEREHKTDNSGIAEERNTTAKNNNAAGPGSILGIKSNLIVQNITKSQSDEDIKMRKGFDYAIIDKVVSNKEIQRQKEEVVRKEVFEEKEKVRNEVFIAQEHKNDGNEQKIAVEISS